MSITIDVATDEAWTIELCDSGNELKFSAFVKTKADQDYIALARGTTLDAIVQGQSDGLCG